MKNSSTNHTKNLLLAFCAAALAGCGSAIRVADLPLAINPEIARSMAKPAPNAVVSIQYPMLLSESAKNQLIEAYPCKFNELFNHSMSSCGNPHFTGSMAPMLAEQSTYYAAELKEIIGQYMDRHNIFLEPFIVDYKDGEFLERPLLSVNTPSSIVINIFDFPQSVKTAIGSGPLIFSSIRTAGGVSPETCGTLFMAGEHIGLAKNKNLCTKMDARNSPTIHPLRIFGKKKTDLAKYSKSKEKPIAPGSILVTGALWQKNDDEYLKKSGDSGFKATAQSIQGPEVRWLARATVNALNKVDTQAAFDAGFAVYLQDYDAGLGSRFAQRALQPGDDRKIAVARKLLEAEIDWLASQNAAITDGILNGNYGKSFRQTRWVMAQAYNKAQALQWLQVGATLIGGFSSGLFGGAGAYNPSMLMVSTLQTEQRFSSMQNQIEQTLLESLAPGVEMRSKVVQVSLDGVNTSLSGASHSEIRTQLLALYKKLTSA